MKEVRYWVTDDGTTFEDYKAASNYEADCRYRAVKDDIIALDCTCERIEATNVDETYYLYIKSGEAFEWWSDFCRIADSISRGIDCTGKYVFDAVNEVWANLDDKIAKLEKAREMLEWG